MLQSQITFWEMWNRWIFNQKYSNQSIWTYQYEHTNMNFNLEIVEDIFFHSRLYYYYVLWNV